MNPEQILEKLGYSQQETRIYLAALELGEATVSELADKVGIPRTTVREYIDSMAKKGLLNHLEKRNHTYFVAEDPSRLMIQLKETESELASILPKLEIIRRKSLVDKPKIGTFYGIEEIKKIFDDMIETKKPILAVDVWRDIRELLGVEFMNSFIKRRHEHFLKIRLILERSESSSELKRTDAEQLRRTRFLPENYQLRGTTNYVYGDKVAIISLNQKEPTGIVIEDPNIANTMSVYFESLWNQSSD